MITSDQPSDQNEGICLDYEPGYGDPLSAVRGQDYAGGVSAYDDDVYINHVLAIQDEYEWKTNDPSTQYALIIGQRKFLFPFLVKPLG